ncbi:MAG: FtsX-like permease family protein [Clostridium sp.]|uniref:ABC transporter permease n=1 Tax=Clostridium sp. TaxID=1506 RepID=UPI0030503170
MRSFWAIIPRYIKTNKNRVIFIALSIIISMSVVVSMSFIKDALRVTLYEKMVNDMGGVYDYFGQSMDHLDYNSLKNEKEIKDITLEKSLGTSKIPNTKYSIAISSYEDNVADLLNFKLIDGRYPKEGNEIAVEQWILDMLPEKYEIGDSIELQYVTTYIKKSGDVSTKTYKNEFVIVGTFEHIYRLNSNFSQGKAYVNPEFVKSLLEETSSEKVQETVYLTMKSEYSTSETVEKWASADNYKSTYFIKNQAKFNFQKDNEKYNYIMGFIFLILAGISSVIIYNIFNVSVAERTKEFGMLRAVGCPPWKIKAMVIGEGLIMAVIFIPLGIVIGSYVTKGIIKFTTGVEGLGGVSSIPPKVLAIALIIGILTIIIGSYFPARRAARISPIAAISSNNNLNLEGSKIKIGFQQNNFIGKRFKFETNIALLNLIRNKNRFMTTCISIVITVAMFITVSYVIGKTNPVAVFKESFDGDFKIISKAWITKGKTEELKNIDGVEKIITSKETYTSLEIVDTEKITKEGIGYIEELANTNSAYKDALKQNRFIIPSPCIAYKREQLEELKNHVISGDIDIETMNTEPTVVLAQNLNGYNYTNIKAGDSIYLRCHKVDEAGNIIGSTRESFIVSAIVDDNAFKHLDSKVGNMVILSEPVMEEYMWVYGFQRINVAIDNGAEYSQCESEINQVLKNVRGWQLYSFKDELKKVERDNRQVVFAMYAVVIIVAIVSIINLISIMSMNAIVRRQEFGFMRAMGLSEKQLKKIVRQEGVIYGVISGGLASVLGTIISIVIAFKSKILFDQEITWSFPLIEIGVTFVVTVVITTVLSILTSRILFKLNIVESIRKID